MIDFSTLLDMVLQLGIIRSRLFSCFALLLGFSSLAGWLYFFIGASFITVVASSIFDALCLLLEIRHICSAELR
jgi:hypothetical protein